MFRENLNFHALKNFREKNEQSLRPARWGKIRKSKYDKIFGSASGDARGGSNFLLQMAIPETPPGLSPLKSRVILQTGCTKGRYD